MTWFGAQKACRTMKAHLVDIKSKEENDFVVSLLSTKGNTVVFIKLDVVC